MRPLFPVALALVLFGCKPSTSVKIDPKPTGTFTTNTTTTGTTTTTTTTTTTEPPYDCSSIPDLPPTVDTLFNYSDSEDFDFDGDGYAVAVYQGNLVGKNQAGDVKVIATDMRGDIAGMRTLSTGDFVVAKHSQGAVVLVDTASGSVTTAMGGFSYPNGVEVDEFDNVYVADQDRGLLVRFNAYNPDDNEIIATGLEYPNGVIMSPDGLTIYVGSFGGGYIYAIDQNPDGSWADARVLFESPGPDQGYDGINVDICGNIYWTEYIVGKVRRMTPDGLDIQLVADLPSFWIPNLRWGNGVGGWDEQTLYVSDRRDGRLFGLELGVPGKKHVVLP